MAKIGNGTGKAAKAAKVEKVEIVVPHTASGQIDYASLYDKVDENKTVRQAHASVTAVEIREVIDGLFDSGKDEVAVATVCDMVNILHGLEKKDDVDTRVQNSSVRSAGTSGKKYLIKTINMTALFVKNPEYVAPKED